MNTAKALRTTARVMRKGIVMGQGEAAKRLEQAADTIERLTEELAVEKIGSTLINEQAGSDRAAVRPMLDKIRKLVEERDAALAEVERLKKENGELRRTFLEIPYGSADELAERYKGMED